MIWWLVKERVPRGTCWRLCHLHWSRSCARVSACLYMVLRWCRRNAEVKASLTCEHKPAWLYGSERMILVRSIILCGKWCSACVCSITCTYLSIQQKCWSTFIFTRKSTAPGWGERYLEEEPSWNLSRCFIMIRLRNWVRRSGILIAMWLHKALPDEITSKPFIS